MKKNKEDLKGAIKFLKQFMTMSYKQQVDLIKKLEKKIERKKENDICTRT